MADNWELRPYQKECKDILDKTPTGNHLVVMATGLGKTVVLSHLKRNGRVLLLSHRDELVRQPEKYYDCTFGIEKADEHASDEEVVSASVQSLARPERLGRFSPDDFDTIIIDEAHHSAAKTYREILKYFSGANRRIGFTATPQRGDNVRLTDIFDDIIFNRDLRWGIENGYLSRIRCEEVRGKFKLKNVKKYRGDYSDSDLEKTLERGEAIATAAKAYVKKCLDRHTLIYCVTKKLCYLLKDTIIPMLPEEERDSICVITGDTPADERKQILKNFYDGRIKCIINCMVLTEGTDLPICDTIISVRPTCNPTLYQQMAGRGTRLYDGKEYCLLIDIVPEDSALVRNLCTAPTLFGVAPALLNKEQKKAFTPNTDLLALCDSLRGLFATEAQRMEIETRKVDLFLDSCKEALEACQNKPVTELASYYDKMRQAVELDYDFGNIDVEICPDEDRYYKITPSWNETIYISKPDILENVNIEFHISGIRKTSILSGSMKMDKAIELVRTYCEAGLDMYAYSWNKKAQSEWSSMHATDRQTSRVAREYKKRGILVDKAADLNKLDASRLIDLSSRMKEAEKRKKLLVSAESQSKNGQKAKETLNAELKEEELIRADGKKEFPAFCDKVFSRKSEKVKQKEKNYSKFIPEIGQCKKLFFSEDIVSPPGKPATDKQISFLCYLMNKAEKYVSFPELPLRELSMRQVSALISLTKKAIDLFGSIRLDSYNVRMEFCELPEFIKSAEKNASASYSIKYQRKQDISADNAQEVENE